MILNSIIISLCVSLDAMGIGLTYGLKNTKISLIGKSILFITFLTTTTISVIIGNYILNFFNPSIAKIIGAILLCSLGIWIIIKSITEKKSNNKLKINNINELEDKAKQKNTKKEKKFEFFIKFLGITIQIIKDPCNSDLDNSNDINGKEAIYLGIAVSLDAFAVGICSSIMGFNSFLYPPFASIFHLGFVMLGMFIGKKIREISNIPQNIWSIISGVLLVLIGISKILF